MTTPALRELVWQLPGGKRFLDTIQEALAAGRSVIALVPNEIDVARITDRLVWDLAAAHLEAARIELSDTRASHIPALVLHDAFGLEGTVDSSEAGLEAIASTPNAPPVVALFGFDELPTEARAAWLEFLPRWSSTAARTSVSTVPSAVLIITGSPDMAASQPRSDVRLAVQWWWGVVSALELRLACRTAETEVGSAAEWREHILPALCGGDLCLAEDLWATVRSPFTDLVSELECNATERGWTREMLVELGADRVVHGRAWGSAIDAPPPSLCCLWSCGALLRTPEYGVELHPAALAALGEHETIRHRIWRGQSGLLLPLVDIVRVETCLRLNERCDPNWATSWDEPDSADERTALRANSLSCQLGHLKRLLRLAPHVRSEQRSLPAVERAWKIRNELAHYRLVSFADYREFIEQTEALTDHSRAGAR